MTDSDDWLLDTMIEQMTCRKTGFNLDFCIGTLTNANAIPIDDPTIEQTSSPAWQATISIDPQ